MSFEIITDSSANLPVEIIEKYHLHIISLILRDGGKVFDDTREENLKEKLSEERKEKAAYAKKVGQLTMQVDWLKKKSEEMLGPDYESQFSPKPPFDD